LKSLITGTLIALQSLRSETAERTYFALESLCPSYALTALISDFTLQALQSEPLCACCTSASNFSLESLAALRAGITDDTLWSDVADISLITLDSLTASTADKTLCADYTLIALCSS
jgi:hypothetical protein